MDEFFTNLRNAFCKTLEKTLFSNIPTIIYNPHRREPYVKRTCSLGSKQEHLSGVSAVVAYDQEDFS